MISVTLISIILPALFLGSLRPLQGDESIFLYGGQLINLGSLPYSDFFDHKGPMLYFLNAIGLKIPFPNLSGTVFLQALLVCMALIVVLESYFRISKGYKKRKYLFFLFLVSAAIFTTIHFFGTTELWALPFQLASYALVTHKISRNDYISTPNKKIFIDNEIFIAIVLSASFITNFLIRPNNSIGILFACIVNIIYVRNSFFRIKILLVYVLTISFFVFLLNYKLGFLGHNQLNLFFEQYLIYNSSYSSGLSLTQKIYGSAMLFINLIKLPIFLILIFMISVVKLKTIKSALAFFLITVLFIDFSSQLISGRGVSSYLVAILAAIVNIIAFILSSLEIREKLFRVIVSVSVILFISNMSVEEMARRWHDDFKFQIQATNYLITNTTPKDKVFYLGNNPAVLVRANRVSVSKVVYIAPLLSGFYPNRAKLVEETYSDLILNRPIYVIQSVEHSCELTAKKCYDLNSQYLAENLAIPNIRKFIRDNYALEETVGGENFYRLIK